MSSEVMELLSFSVLSVQQQGFQDALWWWVAAVSRATKLSSECMCAVTSWPTHRISPVFSSSWFAGYPSCTANRLKGAGGKRMRWRVGSLLKAVNAHSSTLEGIPWFMLANCLVLGCRNISPGSSFSLSVSCYSFAWCSAYKVSCYNHPIQQPAVPAHCIWTLFFPLHQPC